MTTYSIVEIAVRVVDDRGEVHLYTAVATNPGALLGMLKPYLGRLRRWP